MELVEVLLVGLHLLKGPYMKQVLKVDSGHRYEHDCNPMFSEGSASLRAPEVSATSRPFHPGGLRSSARWPSPLPHFRCPGGTARSGGFGA